MNELENNILKGKDRQWRSNTPSAGVSDVECDPAKQRSIFRDVVEGTAPDMKGALNRLLESPHHIPGKHG